jgi:putative SOS response-associated peptidase YedK
MSIMRMSPAGSAKLLRRDEGALTIAGIWDEWQHVEADKSLKTCTMIITEPNKFVAEVHDRTPVLLAEKDYEPWLSGKAGSPRIAQSRRRKRVAEMARFKTGQQFSRAGR